MSQEVVQKEVVAEIDGYQAAIRRLVNAIAVEEKKIQAILARIRGEQQAKTMETEL